MPKIEQEVWSRVKYIGFVFALCTFVALIQEKLQLSRIEFLGTLTLIGMGLLIITVWGGFNGLEREMYRGFREVKELLLKQGIAKDPAKEEGKTTGAGAFGGMVIGGLLGLLLGPVGVIIGGVVGAIIGDQVERESIKAERERRRKLNF